MINVLKDFSHEVSTNRIRYEPHYITYEFPWKEYLGTDQCICGDRYCLLWANNATEILGNNLWHACVYKNSQEVGKDPYTFIDYMDYYFSTKRLLNQTYQSELGLGNIAECVANSFSPAVQDISQCTNTGKNLILEKNKQNYLSYKQDIYVNGRPIKNYDTEPYLKELICATLAKQKFESCRGTSSAAAAAGKISETNWILIIILLVIVVVIVNIIIVCLCRRYSSRRVHERLDDKDIENRVTAFIRNYSQFKELTKPTATVETK
jgi:hypothetical protein